LPSWARKKGSTRRHSSTHKGSPRDRRAEEVRMNKILEATYDPTPGSSRSCRSAPRPRRSSIPTRRLTLEEAQVLDPEAQVGEQPRRGLSTKDLGRIAAQDCAPDHHAEGEGCGARGHLHEFIGRKGEILNGIVQRYERDCLVIDSEDRGDHAPVGTDSRERYRQGDRVRAYIKDVTKTSSGGLRFFSPGPTEGDPQSSSNRRFRGLRGGGLHPQRGSGARLPHQDRRAFQGPRRRPRGRVASA